MILLLPVCFKVIEKVVYNKMLSFINKYNLLSASQFEFRAHHSPNHAIKHLTDLITSYLDKLENH